MNAPVERRSLAPRHPDALQVPVVGLGTSVTLDTDDLELAAAVVAATFEAGSTFFDSSPMYGKAERVLGACIADRRDEAQVATKVWTDDDRTAARQIEASLGYYGGRIDLLQIHNMVRWPQRLEQIEARREAGQVVLVGATHWRPESFGELEVAMATGRIDAIQVPYNPMERDVERRLLPLATDLGLGVVIMRPFANRELLGRFPSAAELAPLADFGIETWPQALLKWGLSHPATTVSIPATSRPARAAENAAAGRGPWLDEESRALVSRLAGH